MKVSVAIPSYNSEKFLVSAVQSIFRQGNLVQEILIIDDRSTDKSYEIAQQLIRQDKRIKVVKNDINLGYATNWNKCLKLASYNYVLLLHSDDVLKPDALKKQLDFFKLHPEVALVGGMEDSIDTLGNIIIKQEEREDRYYKKGEIYEFIKEAGSYIPCSTVMFDMEKIRKVGFFQENVLATDELYWPKVLQYYPIAVLGSSLINRRRHEGQTEYSDFKYKKEKIVGWVDYFMNILEYEKRPDKKKALLSLIKNKISNAYISISGSVIKYHHSIKLWFYYTYHALRFNPMILFRIQFWKSMAKSVLSYFKLIS